MPLQVLWTDEGDLAATRIGPLDRETIRELLRRGPVQFAVANVGDRLRWIPLRERFELWKGVVSVQLAEGERFYLDDLPNGVALVASEWLAAEHDPAIVLLEVHH